ncbi:hypothetical protein [Nocardioides nanhaiensis]|uniref:Bacteriocin-protection protein n=1 Tax=Nocardioides nanhaiensis TaxID=1476871 RepID=A0ABP8W1X5_9ACTN
MTGSLVRASDAGAWRTWLLAHATTEPEAWLVLEHRDSPRPGIGMVEAVEHALCVGWIDSTRRRHDEHASVMRFSPRRRRSTWSASNRERVARLTAAGLMTPAGLGAVERARALGTWDPTPTGTVG